MFSASVQHGYKWVMSGFGLGALYVAPEAVDRIRPTFVGTQSVQMTGEVFEPDLTWKPGAARYGAGGINRIGLASLGASLGLIEEIGIDQVEAHDRALAEQLYSGLQRKPGIEIVSSDDLAHRSAVTVFTTGSKAKDAALVDHLEAQGIIVALRPLGVRVSPHLYNTEDEIERADDDGFARTGFACDDVATGLEFQRQVAHESEVFDAQRRQHG